MINRDIVKYLCGTLLGLSTFVSLHAYAQQQYGASCKNIVTYKAVSALLPASVPLLSKLGMGVLIVLIVLAGVYYSRGKKSGIIPGFIALTVLCALGAGVFVVQQVQAAGPYVFSALPGSVLEIDEPPVNMFTPAADVLITNTSSRTVRITALDVESVDANSCKVGMLIPSGGHCYVKLACVLMTAP